MARVAHAIGVVLIPTVPHDQSGDVSTIDGGPLYDSTVPE